MESRPLRDALADGPAELPASGDGHGAGSSGPVAMPSPDADIAPPPVDAFAGEYDNFDLEAELEDMIESDIDELAATFDEPGPDAQVHEPAIPLAVGGADASIGCGEDPTLLEQIVEVAEAEAEAVGLDLDADPDGIAEPPLVPLVPLPPPSEAHAEGPHLCIGPTPMGYVNLSTTSEGVLRIQRGKPRGSLSVRCYRHPACSFLMPLWQAPTDADLIAWAFEVEKAPRGMRPEDRKNLADRHMASARRFRVDPAASSGDAPPLVLGGPA
jgi:hypothetical protein